MESAAFYNLLLEVIYHHFCHILLDIQTSLVQSIRCEYQEAALRVVTLIANTNILISSRKIHVWA